MLKQDQSLTIELQELDLAEIELLLQPSARGSANFAASCHIPADQYSSCSGMPPPTTSGPASTND